MDGTRNNHEEMKNDNKIFSEVRKGRDCLGYAGIGWTKLAQYRDRYDDHVDAVMDIRAP
jgi:hypothetical protein